ncbi:hypothetical protein F4774DRAFT_402105 [Daldinia eschscholtzii]|nr:hypothetical protein F4774DRAFT_402105 [Daldinia eschscholtzii]
MPLGYRSWECKHRSKQRLCTLSAVSNPLNSIAVVANGFKICFRHSGLAGVRNSAFFLSCFLNFPVLLYISVCVYTTYILRLGR